MLYHCKTIAHTRISDWLQAQGITKDDIAAAELLDAASVRITNPAGQYLVIRQTGSEIQIDTSPAP